MKKTDPVTMGTLVSKDRPVVKKQRKRSSKKPSFFQDLVPENINLTINLQDEDKKLVIDKIDEMKGDLIFNWRIF